MTTRLDKLREHIHDELDLADADQDFIAIVTTKDNARDILSLIDSAVAWRRNVVDVMCGLGSEPFKYSCPEAKRLAQEAAKWTDDALK